MSFQNSNISQVAAESSVKSFFLTEDSASKLSPESGKKIAEYINGMVRGTNSYFFQRNNRIRRNRLWANGRVDIKQMFSDRLEMNGKVNYTNISWKAPSIISTTISRMIGSWMRRTEKIEVSAVDPISLGNKLDAEDMARFVFEQKEALAALEQASGEPMVSKDQFIAEDKDELDAWVAEFNRLPEEIKYEMGVNNIIDANGFFSTNKELLLKDSAEAGLVCTYTYMDEIGQVHINWIKPENAIYSYSEFPDFRDTTFRGHIFSMKISDLRAKYSVQFGGKLTEEEIFKIAQTAKEYQQLDKLTWINDWNFMFVRPYDEWNVDCIRFEVKSVDKKVFTKTVTKKNKSTLINEGVPKKLDVNQNLIEDKKWNIYEGVFVIATQTMLKWGIKVNMIRPQDPKELGDVEFSYSFYMYQNYDMRNLAVPEKVEEPVEQMILARLKIQQLVAKMKPAGAAINVDAMQELDLGLASATKPLEVQKIWEQTGNLYYRGKDAEGNPIPMPISELQNAGFIGQMQALINLYQFHFQVLKDELGNDPNLSQSAAQPRVSQGNIQASMQLSDDSSDYMYDAVTRVLEDTAKKVACLLNSSVTFQAKAYRHLLREDEVKGRNFITRSRMLPTDQEIGFLMQQVNQATASNPDFAVYLDQFKLMRMAKENVKLATLYYGQCMKRMIADKKKQVEANSQMNAQAQQQSLQMKAKADSQLMTQELSLKTDLSNTESRNKMREIILTGILANMGKGIQVDEKWKPVVDEIIQNVGLPLFAENMNMTQQMQQGGNSEQQMQKQAQGEQIQQQGQEMPQEEMEQQLQMK